MKESPFSLDIPESEESVGFKETLFKYLRYWPWFLAALVLALAGGYLYMRYAPTIYSSVAKIRIIDDGSEMDITSEALSAFTGSSKINLDNEIEVLKSYRLLRQVVTALNLDISYYINGRIKSTQTWNPPFIVKLTDSVTTMEDPRSFEVTLENGAITVTDEAKNSFNLPLNEPNSQVPGIPFTIFVLESTDLTELQVKDYKIIIKPIKETVLELARTLQVDATNKKSDILSLSMTGESAARSEAILNTVIEKFNEDNIVDRQLVSKRTLDFIDQRFVYLSEELDSIEVGKQDFKQENSLSNISEDASFTLQKKALNEEEALSLRTQLSLSNLLEETVNSEAGFGLLPSDIGLANSSINSLVADYNTLVLERDKLMVSVGESHPTLKALNGQLTRAKQNILNTVMVYQQQIQTSLNQRTQEKNLAGTMFSQLPEKEKVLRSIERQQSIKENLFLLLLQKREEAAINYAVTAPSIKVVDYGLTGREPIAPQKLMVYPISLLLGLLIPFGVLFIRFSLDSKIHDRTDLEKATSGIPVLAEIPFLKEHKVMDADDRSLIGESFRILNTNVHHLLPKKDKEEGQVIYITSAIKGEGKTLLALNMSFAYASMKKRVLLIGADLRNPQLASYFPSDVERDKLGLSSFLRYPKTNWEDSISSVHRNPYHNVCFTGTIPPNPSELLSGENFELFLDHVKREFDYIIVDTAPTLLVADTLLISDYADITLFVVRAGFTDKRLLNYARELHKTDKLKNMAMVINDVDIKNYIGYNYGYTYEDQNNYTTRTKRNSKRTKRQKERV